MATPKLSYLTTVSPEYPTAHETLVNDLKSYSMKLIKAFREDMNKLGKEIQENIIKEVKKNEENCSKPENRNRSNKESTK